MADAADVQAVRDELPPEAAALGWTQEKIEQVLDEPNSVVRTIRRFWSYRVAQTNEFVNISESGSSRSMEAVFNHALAMLQYWDGRVKEEDEGQGTLNPRQRIAFHSATRV